MVDDILDIICGVFDLITSKNKFFIILLFLIIIIVVGVIYY